MDFIAPVKNELAEVERELNSMVPAEPHEVYGMLPEFIKRGGKRIRPVLALLSAQAAGGNAKNAIRTAALIEMFHNFTLVHDDIEDNSQMRRGKPTLNAEYGIPLALNSGDAFYSVIWKEIVNLQEQPERKDEIQKMLAAAFLKVVEGQGIELGWYKARKLDISEKEYNSMVAGKTGALIAVSCEAGGYIGGADMKTREALREYGRKIGIAFQIQDDMLNVSGDFGEYGKEIGGDITEGKRTLMFVKAYEKATDAEKKELGRILLSNTTSQKEIAYVISLFERYGATEYARKTADRMVSEAKRSLGALPESKAKEALLAVADYMINRKK